VHTNVAAQADFAVFANVKPNGLHGGRSRRKLLDLRDAMPFVACLLCIAALAALTCCANDRDVLQLLDAFLSMSLCAVCANAIASSSLDVFVLSLGWAAWIVFGMVTHKIGWESGRYEALAAHSVSVSAILLTYSQATRAMRWAIPLVTVACLGSIVMFPRKETNAFEVQWEDAVLHVSVFAASFVVTGYFDALVDAECKDHECVRGTTKAVRALRVAWVLFVENSLLFFLVPQILVTVLQVNYALEVDPAIEQLSRVLVTPPSSSPATENGVYTGRESLGVVQYGQGSGGGGGGGSAIVSAASGHKYTQRSVDQGGPRANVLSFQKAIDSSGGAPSVLVVGNGGGGDKADV